MSEPKLPNKSLFKLDEVSPLVGVKPYVLRFWENQFPEISPIRSSSGQMLYREEDVQAILKIKELLFEKKLSVEQAKLVMGGTELEAVVATEQKPTKTKSSRVIKAVKVDDVEKPLEAAAEKDNDAISALKKAKSKLAELLLETESLKKTHHWD